LADPVGLFGRSRTLCKFCGSVRRLIGRTLQSDRIVFARGALGKGFLSYARTRRRSNDFLAFAGATGYGDASGGFNMALVEHRDETVNRFSATIVERNIFRKWQ